jgi:hypothetical protein
VNVFHVSSHPIFLRSIFNIILPSTPISFDCSLSLVFLLHNRFTINKFYLQFSTFGSCSTCAIFTCAVLYRYSTEVKFIRILNLRKGGGFLYKYQFSTVGTAIAQSVQWLMRDEQSRKLGSTPGRVKTRFPSPELPCRLWSLLSLQLTG